MRCYGVITTTEHSVLFDSFGFKGDSKLLSVTPKRPAKVSQPANPQSPRHHKTCQPSKSPLPSFLRILYLEHVRIHREDSIYCQSYVYIYVFVYTIFFLIIRKKLILLFIFFYYISPIGGVCSLLFSLSLSLSL